MQFDEENVFVGCDFGDENGSVTARSILLEAVDEVERYKNDLNRLYEKLFGDLETKKLSWMQENTPSFKQTDVTLNGLHGMCLSTISIDEWIGLDILEESPKDPPDRDISTIKKELKHCKNHMQRIKLEQELAAAYKERRKKHGDRT